MPDAKSNPSPKTTTGLPVNTEAALAYVFGWISGLVLLLLEKDNKKVKYHALQSLVTFGAAHLIVIILGMIPVLGWAIMPFFGIGTFILWLILIVKTFQGEDVKLPIVKDFVNKQLK
jgi:uncharacterized membrane protein